MSVHILPDSRGIVCIYAFGRLIVRLTHLPKDWAGPGVFWITRGSPHQASSVTGSFFSEPPTRSRLKQENLLAYSPIHPTALLAYLPISPRDTVAAAGVADVSYSLSAL